MVRYDAYCTYHQRKGHATNFYKSLEVAILDLIDQGKYQIDDIDSNPRHTINTITVENKVYVGLRIECPHHVPNPVTIE